MQHLIYFVFLDYYYNGWCRYFALPRGGNIELDPTKYLFYKFVAAASAILLYLIHGGWFVGGWLGQGCWFSFFFVLFSVWYSSIPE